MILTGSKLQEIGLALYGDSWPSVMAHRLKKHRRTIFRWRDDSPPAELKRELLQLVENQIAELGALYEELREDVGAF
ncbi:hypothetical protein [uncultured Devosia sp.]|uniref:hypothetical protein n=1 Tax=uncultured Devosia sp. TaxID=211434 RepID=UPI002620139E|nr:hypothetical protein [uncultured Devosia sp.]